MKQRVNILTIIFISFLLCLFMADSALSECPGGGGGGVGTGNSSSSNGSGGGAGPIGGSGSPGGSGSDGGGSSATGNHNYDSSWSLEYATGNPTNLSPGSTAEITVLGGYQNFLWTIGSDNESLVFVENGSTEIETSKRTVTVRASDDVACKTTATIVVKDKFGDTDGGEIDISPSLSLEWDTVNSAQTISANGSCTIAVVEQGGGPYLWEVTGGSAYFNSAHTQSIIETANSSTTLYASNACGAITITVSDTCGLTTTGYVRSTTGTWKLHGETPHVAAYYKGQLQLSPVSKVEIYGPIYCMEDWIKCKNSKTVVSSSAICPTCEGDFNYTISGGYDDDDAPGGAEYNFVQCCIVTLKLYTWQCN